MASNLGSSSRAERTRAALIAAGFDLLVDRPIDAIPIDDIVAHAAVGKGSFFNHFADKRNFAEAIATEVRLELEALVSAANAARSDPVERIAKGMRVGADFALNHPKRSAVLVRSQGQSTAPAHPLNEGLRNDFAAAAAQGMLRDEAAESGLLYWLGLCQMLMISLVESRPSVAEANKRVRDMTVLGLSGLGISYDRAVAIAGK